MKQYLDELQKKLGRAKFEDLTSTAGILIVLGIVILVNLIASTIPARLDLTEFKFFTLSSGTKEILRELDTPVKLSFFATDNRDAMSADERNFAQAVRDRLLEFKKIGGRNVVFEQLNPEPDTNAEDAAELAGLQPLQGQLGPIYLGIVVSCLDRKEIIAALDPRREELLEYDVINAVSRVYRDQKPKIKIMTGINLAGGFSGNFQAPPVDPWFIYNQLKEDYDLEVIPSSTDKIAIDTDVLIVAHPYDITEAGEYAIDQYLLQGGKVVALVDPLFYASRFLASRPNPMMGGMPPQDGPAPSSDLPTLFEAWGVQYKSSQVMADANYQTDIEPPRGRYLPTLLSLGREALNDENVVTSQLTDVYMPFPGAFKMEKTPPGVKIEPLISASENNKLVSSFEAEPQAMDQLRKEFIPTREKGWFYAVRLAGTFKSAFPNGNPNAKEEGKMEEEAAPVPAEVPAAKPEAAAPKPAEASAPKPEAAAPKPAEVPAAKPEVAPKPAPKPEVAPKPAQVPAAKPEVAPKPAEAPAPKPGAVAPKPAEVPAAKPEAAAPAKKEAGGEGAPEEAKKDEATPVSLKESVKPGTVVLVSDMDFIYDRFAVQILNLGPGMRAAQPINQNLSFVQNLVEVLGGDERLIKVRSRQSTRRPFTLLNLMQMEAQAKMRARIESLESKEKELGEKLQAALKVEETESGGQQIIIDQSKIDQGAIDAMRNEQVLARKDLRDARKELKKRQDAFINWLKMINIGLMPLLITAVGFFFFHRRQQGLQAR